MHIHPIRTDEDHKAALREIEALWGADEGSEAGDRLDVLATLAEDYETRRWPIEPLDPVRAIEVAMEMNGHTRAELAALIGQSRATEILSRRRALTLPMIRKIASQWHVPEKVLVQEYVLQQGAIAVHSRRGPPVTRAETDAALEAVREARAEGAR